MNDNDNSTTPTGAQRPEPVVTYRGYGPDHPTGGRLVIIEIDGEVVGPLPHRAKHSTGLSWGYCGSGPADLARSLLIDALGDAARCSLCDGTSTVVYDVFTDGEVPATRATDEQCDDRHGGRIARFSAPMRCLNCENGWTVMPATYQRFKFEVIAQLPEQGWTLDRRDVLTWLRDHHQDGH